MHIHSRDLTLTQRQYKCLRRTFNHFCVMVWIDGQAGWIEILAIPILASHEMGGADWDAM